MIIVGIGLVSGGIGIVLLCREIWAINVRANGLRREMQECERRLSQHEKRPD